jgi:hypothetical protein
VVFDRTYWVTSNFSVSTGITINMSANYLIFTGDTPTEQQNPQVVDITSGKTSSSFTITNVFSIVTPVIHGFGPYPDNIYNYTFDGVSLM